MSGLMKIEQKIKAGEETICSSCIHKEVCRAIENQPCIECSHYMKMPSGTDEEREELVRLLESAESAVYWNSSDRSFIEKIADHLINHGVRLKTEVKFYMISIDPVSEKITANVEIDGRGFEIPLTLDHSSRRMMQLLIADAQGRVEIIPTEEETADKDLKKAIKLLEREYEKALNLKFVRNPLAYALFNVWKIADKKTPKE